MTASSLDRRYAAESPLLCTVREHLPLTLSFANRLGEGETVSAGAASMMEQETGTDVSAVLSLLAASDPSVNVTVDLTHALIAPNTAYLLSVRATIGARTEDLLLEIVTHWSVWA